MDLLVEGRGRAVHSRIPFLQENEGETSPPTGEKTGYLAHTLREKGLL